jgi:hypothetical protein
VHVMNVFLKAIWRTLLIFKNSYIIHQGVRPSLLAGWAGPNSRHYIVEGTIAAWNTVAAKFSTISEAEGGLSQVKSLDVGGY